MPTEYVACAMGRITHRMLFEGWAVYKRHRIRCIASLLPCIWRSELRTIFCTTAAIDLSVETRAEQPSNGMTFLSESVGTGQSEHQVIL